MAKRGCWGVVVSLALCAYVWGLDLNELRQFEIPAQKLSTARVEFSRQAKAPVVSATSEVERFESPGVSGRMSPKRGAQHAFARHRPRHPNDGKS